MAKKKPLSSWTWQGYTLQLSIVIIGVMVTFIGSGLVERWSKARQVRTVMQLIVSELETNRQNIQYVCEKLDYDHRGMLMFKGYGYDLEAVPVDSLDRYNFLFGAVRGVNVQNDALEVLKSSGLLASVGDKQLLLNLLGCYNRLAAFGVSVEQYNDRKIRALNHFTSNMSSDEQRLYFEGTMGLRASWQRMLQDPLCMDFIASTAYFFGGSTYFDEIGEIDKTISELNEKYDFK